MLQIWPRRMAMTTNTCPITYLERNFEKMTIFSIFFNAWSHVQIKMWPWWGLTQNPDKNQRNWPDFFLSALKFWDQAFWGVVRGPLKSQMCPCNVKATDWKPLIISLLRHWNTGVILCYMTRGWRNKNPEPAWALHGLVAKVVNKKLTAKYPFFTFHHSMITSPFHLSLLS